MVGALGVGMTMAIVMSCGPDAPEKREQVEHRIAPCQVVCDSMFDPECGARELSPGLEFEDADECAEMCADPKVSGNWARVDDVDMCKSEYEAFAACLDTATCAEQSEHWNADVFDEFPCKDVAYALGNCYSTVSLETAEGGEG